MRTVRLPNNWVPRDYQMPWWQARRRGVLRCAMAWHRRAGKDDCAMHDAAYSAFERVGNYWHMLPEASQARKAIWDAVNPHTGKKRIDEAFPDEIIKRKRDDAMFIEFVNGSTWQVLGSDNYNSLVGTPPVGVTYSEYALADPQSWAYIRPILLENGGWANFISTFRGENHFSNLVDYAVNDPDWFGQILSVADTGAISLDAIERERRELAAERGDQEANAIIQQEYFCDRNAAIPGSYYGEQMTRAMQQGRIGIFPWLPHLPVGTAWDIGHGDSTVVWFFQMPEGGRIRLIDVLEGSGVGIDWYARRIVQRPYSYAEHLWPHDGGHGNIRDVAGQTLEATARSLGIKPIRIVPRDPVLDQAINACRNMLPLCEFNVEPLPHLLESGELETPAQARERMARALSAIRGYRRIWTEKLRRYSDAPLHDWTSHTADALRTLARGRKPFRIQTTGRRGPEVANLDYPTAG